MSPTLPKPVRVLVFIHLLEILNDIRRRANEVSFDLTGGNFFVTPDDPLLVYVKGHWTKWRASNNVIAARGRWPKIDRYQRRTIDSGARISRLAGRPAMQGRRSLRSRTR